MTSRERVERRLAAVLAADVAGYSRLMGEDEEGTLRPSAEGPGCADRAARCFRQIKMPASPSSINAAGWAVKLPDRVGKRRPFPAPLFRLFYEIEIRYSYLL
jgi:hypothetical protein